MNFDQKAQVWETDKRVVRAETIAKMMSRYLGKRKCVLEFGCGTGLISFNLKELFEQIVLLDTSKGMIQVLEDKIAAGNVKNMRPLVGDLLDSEFDEFTPAMFDAIYSSMVMHHINQIEPLIQKFYELLVKDGMICIVDLDTDDGRFHKDEIDFNGHHGFDQKNLSSTLVDAGFKNIESYTFYHDVKSTPEGDLPYSLFIMSGIK